MDIKDVIKELNKKYDNDELFIGIKYDEIERIPFSSPSLNYTTYGGIPIGRITELFGLPAGGKSTISLDLVAQAQKKFKDKVVLYVDIERTLDKKWASKMSVDTKKLVVFTPRENFAEGVFDSIRKIIRSGSISLVVIDSLGALSSKDEFEKELEDSHKQGGISVPLTRFARLVTGDLTKHRCSLIGINQVRDSFSMYGAGVETPGGKAWKHACSMRIQVSGGALIDSSGKEVSGRTENPAGNTVRVNLIRSKVSPLDRKIAILDLYYDRGLDIYVDIINLGLKTQNIERAGSIYTISGVTDKLRGITQAKQYLKDNPKLCDKLVKKIEEDLN